MVDFSNVLYSDDQLRDYQLENKIKIYEAWRNHKSVMLQMPTGTGKTRLFVSIVRDMFNWSVSNKNAIRTLILAHRLELIDQISENVGYHYHLAHGVIMSRFYQQEKLPTQIASVQTLVRRLEKWEDKGFDIIIIDEAHHALADTYKKIINAFPNAKVLGVTATPYRLNGASFKPFFDHLITSQSVFNFIKKGYLSDYEYYSIRPTSNEQKLIDGITEYAIDGDYAESALSRFFNTSKIRAKIINTYLKYANGKRGIVYTIDINHNDKVCRAFQDISLRASAIDSNTSSEKRKQLVNDFRHGKIDILCNVNIFSEGFDCPDVEFIQLARPTKSLSMYLQQVGRGFRKVEGKEKVIILDNVGLYNRFGLPSASRHWKYHFEGKTVNDEKGYFDEGEIETKVQFIQDIGEGNEKMELVYTSLEDRITEIITINTDFEKFDEDIDFPLIFVNGSSKQKNSLLGADADFSEYEFEDILSAYEPEDEDTIFPFGCTVNTGFRKVRNGGKWGIIDKASGEIVLPIEYDEIKQPDKLLRSKVSKNNLWGIVNCFTWEECIPAIYDHIQCVFWEKFFIVEKDGFQGVINFRNQIIIPIEQEEIWPIKNDKSYHFNVGNRGIWFVKNVNLEEYRSLIKSKVHLISDFYSVKYKGVYGIVSRNDQLVVPFAFSSIKISGIAKAPFFVTVNDGGCGLLDENTDWAILPKYSAISLLPENLLKVKDSSCFGVMSLDGTFIIPCIYGDLDQYKNHFLVYSKEKKSWLALDNNGVEIGIEKSKKKEVKDLVDQMYNNELHKVELVNREKNKDNKIVIQPKTETFLSPIQDKPSIIAPQSNKPTATVLSNNNSVSNDKSRIIRPRIPQSKSAFKIDQFDLIFSDLKHDSLVQKAVLLLTIFDLIEFGHITSLQIGFSENLEKQFKINWERYLAINYSKSKLADAFYYLSREPFWELVPIKGAESILKNLNKSVSISISVFQVYITRAKIDPELFKYLQNGLNREHLKSLLIDKYLKNRIT